MATKTVKTPAPAPVVKGTKPGTVALIENSVVKTHEPIFIVCPEGVTIEQHHARVASSIGHTPRLATLHALRTHLNRESNGVLVSWVAEEPALEVKSPAKPKRVKSPKPENYIEVAAPVVVPVEVK